MGYKYFTAGQGVVSKIPKQEYIDLFAKTVEEQFYNASDWFTITEETSLGSQTYQEIDVRINHVIDTKTGERVGDDFKKLLFPTLDHSTYLGLYYYFDDNYWITVNIDKIKSLTTTITVRRCNNLLRWLDASGGYYEVPCALSYLIKENRDYSTAGSSLVIPSGMVDCIVQFNTKTNSIKPNQRFLFGNANNWTAYRIEGGGINNFINRQTISNTSSGIINFSLSTDYVNEQTDDVVNGIANTVYDNNYSITLNQSSITGSAGQTRELQAVVKLGTEIVSRNVTWSSSNTLKATVNSSGVVTFVSNGTSIITCSLENNSGVYAACTVTVSSTPADVYQIVYTPEENRVLENDNTTWTFSLYKNGAIQADTFTFTLNPRSVPSDHYSFLVTGGNTFIIQNIEKYLEDYMILTATSGAYSTTLNIYLAGKW